jgi:hypothetical protein
MTGWLRRQWREGDTQLWVCGFIVALALIAFTLSLIFPVHFVVAP